MSGELNLSVALMAYANAYCHDCLSTEEQGQLTENVVFRFVGGLQFGDDRQLPPAKAARDWMAALRRLDTRRLWLLPVPATGPLSPALAAGFANGNPTVIVVDCRHPHVLRPQWTTAQSGSPPLPC